MFKFSARLLKADAWNGVDTKIHLQDNAYWAKKVFTGLKNHFALISKQYKIKGVALQEWIKEYGIKGLFAAQNQDPAIRKAMNDVRALLKDTVVPVEEGGQFRNNEIKAFREEFGNNVADWIYTLAGEKRASRSDKTSSTECRYCDAPVAANWQKHGETPMCQQCIDEDKAVSHKPRSKGVISALIAPAQRFADPTEADWGPEPVYTDFNDVLIYVFDAEGEEIPYHISGTAWRENDEFHYELSAESEKLLQGIDQKKNDVGHQIYEEVRV